MPEAHVCVVGSVNVDTTLVLASLPLPGETALSSARHTFPGGKGANQAAAAAAVGAQVSFVAAVGDDPQGEAVRRNLADRGVDVSAMQVVAGADTGAAVILVADDGENVIVVDAAANGRLDAQHVRAYVSRRQPAVILVQLEIPLDAVLAAAQAKGSATFILNPAPMPRRTPQLDRVLDLVDVLVPNRTELAQLVGRPVPTTDDELAQCAATLAFHGWLVVTLGAQGVAVFSEQGRARLATLPAPEVTAVDTSGAGDAFCGVLADALARGETVLTAAALGNQLAAYSTTVRGAQLPRAASEAGDVQPAAGDGLAAQRRGREGTAENG